MSIALSAPALPTTAAPEAAAPISLDIRSDESWATRHARAWADLRETARLWRLCCTLGWLDIKLRYRGSMLGPFWLTLSTAVMVGSMGVLYATLFKMELHDYLPFLALSLVLWNFLSTLVGDACSTFTQVEGTIRSIRMPFAMYGMRVVLRNLMVLGHNLVVIVAVYLYFSIHLSDRAIVAIPAVALWLIDGVAIAVLAGTLCARFRDVPPIVGSVMQIAFFMTPVIWRADLVHSHQWILPLNPFFSLLEIVRAPLLGAIPSIEIYASAVVYSALLLAGTWMLFARVRGRIAFWI